jgi:hypothetical protein
MGIEKTNTGDSRLPAANVAIVKGQVYFAEDKSKNGFARIYYDTEDGRRVTVNSLSSTYDSSNHEIASYYVTFPTLQLDYSSGKYALIFSDGKGSKSTYNLSDIYPSQWTWSGGTTAGPTASIKLLRNGLDYGNVSVAAIPTASTSASGIITTGSQTLAGEKTFNNKMTVGTGSSSGTILQVSGNANITYKLSFNDKAHLQYDNADECLYFTF